MQKVYTKIESIVGNVVTVRAPGVRNGDLALVGDSYANVIKLDKSLLDHIGEEKHHDDGFDIDYMKKQFGYNGWKKPENWETLQREWMAAIDERARKNAEIGDFNLAERTGCRNLALLGANLGSNLSSSR